MCIQGPETLDYVRPISDSSCELEAGASDRKACGIWEGRKVLEQHDTVGVSCCQAPGAGWGGDQGSPSSCESLPLAQWSGCVGRELGGPVSPALWGERLGELKHREAAGGVPAEG